jgi:3-deoxy-D-manno-octulosonic-acid transferase
MRGVPMAARGIGASSGIGGIAMMGYDAATIAAGVLAAPVLPLLALTRYGVGLSERLGTLPATASALEGAGAIWIHAASVGEVLAATSLIEGLRARHADWPILLSATSMTGRETARKLPGVAAAVLAPIDLRWIVGSALRRIRPRLLVVMETEIWPALLRAARALRIPVVVVSGRISVRAARRYALIRPLLRETLQCVSAFAMQTQADADRLLALGAPRDRVRVIGSLKYARFMPANGPGDGRCTLPGTDGRAVLIAASTQPTEEQLVLEACAGLWPAHPDCLLIIAPRRPERFEEVNRLLTQMGVRSERRSQLAGSVRPETQAVLLDSVGELRSLVGGARAVFVGGTVASLGGHNVLEPAAAAVPVCFGPHTENVKEAADALLAGGGGTRIHDASELREFWRRALTEPEAARAMGACALRVVRARAEVVTETLAVLEQVLR